MGSIGRALGWSLPVRLTAIALMISAPYTFTNWLVRGAMAEFAAAMIVPWVIREVIRLQTGRVGRIRAGHRGR